MTVIVCERCEAVAIEIPVDIGYTTAVCGDCAGGGGE